MKQVIFVIPPTTQILDLGGPLQVFSEAIDLGASYHLRFVGLGKQVRTAQGLTLANLAHFSEVDIRAGDLIFVAGINSDQLSPQALSRLGTEFYAWLQSCHACGAKLLSICNAAFILAHAGILNGKKCTTHWSRLEALANQYPEVTVLENRLFVRDDLVYSSAGICSGLDLALALIEEDQGPLFTAKLAQVLVIYLRRDGSQPQQSIYLDYRTHLNPVIHQVQDVLTQRPETQMTIDDLAAKVHVSPRHLTRQFKKETGITIKTFVTLVRMERADKLLRNPKLGVDAVAAACGFQNARQFRRLWRRFKGCSPSESRLAHASS